MIYWNMRRNEKANFKLGRQGEAVVINESGLYAVILRSDKPQAKPFRKWVTSEALPTIRKHGAYMTEQTIEKALTNPDFLWRIEQPLCALFVRRRLNCAPYQTIQNDKCKLKIYLYCVAFDRFEQD